MSSAAAAFDSADFRSLGSFQKYLTTSELRAVRRELGKAQSQLRGYRSGRRWWIESHSLLSWIKKNRMPEAAGADLFFFSSWSQNLANKLYAVVNNHCARWDHFFRGNKCDFGKLFDTPDDFRALTPRYAFFASIMEDIANVLPSHDHKAYVRCVRGSKQAVDTFLNTKGSELFSLLPKASLDYEGLYLYLLDESVLGKDVADVFDLLVGHERQAMKEIRSKGDSGSNREVGDSRFEAISYEEIRGCESNIMFTPGSRADDFLTRQCWTESLQVILEDETETDIEIFLAYVDINATVGMPGGPKSFDWLSIYERIKGLNTGLGSPSAVAYRFKQIQKRLQAKATGIDLSFLHNIC